VCGDAGQRLQTALHEQHAIRRADRPSPTANSASAGSQPSNLLPGQTAQAHRSVPTKQRGSSSLTGEARDISAGRLFLQSAAKGKLEGLEQSGTAGFPCEEKKAGLMKQNHPTDTATPFKDGPGQALKFWMGQHFSASSSAKQMHQCCWNFNASHKAKDVWRPFSWQVKATESRSSNRRHQVRGSIRHFCP